MPGTVDLQGLPMKIEVLALSDNILSGAIFLSNLPDSLTEIDLSRNRQLGTPTIMYGDLPLGMGKIDLRSTKVKRAEAYSPMKRR
eukprot:CAMPEP_0201529884 /NCGR_PEP_ID=MMETSP0161_2-20130828/43084_1 /ASSEMBLY_ACC=CAM_ASM_000251 /TAXON_ID=180227 /ORGANISM="Neoparamoeba aestuarina, Strain SoJaBio B1-5/56/2" /LENGTH=84 /DNA_ID=CAMNT_0047931925 /DNA_START=132 /DNA_END=383 /DNA_ORIENTATION=-